MIFPNATWVFLIHIAENACRAFSTVHNHGHVVGDVNSKNLLVGSDGPVKFIDCDSFQVKHAGRVFPCSVGVDHFTPPELQGTRNLSRVVRTPNHDLFGLAVLIFELLFHGSAPVCREALQTWADYDSRSNSRGHLRTAATPDQHYLSGRRFSVTSRRHPRHRRTA